MKCMDREGVADYLERVVQELLPWAEQRFGLSPEPCDRRKHVVRLYFAASKAMRRHFGCLER